MKNEKLYHITYRNEIMVTLPAKNEQDAQDKALASTNWEFIGDWWEEYAEIEEANVEDGDIRLSK